MADLDTRQPDVDQGQPLGQGRLLLRAVAELGGQRRRRRRALGRTVHVQHRHQQSLRHQLQLRQCPPRDVPELHRDRRVLRGQGQALHLGVLPSGHLEGFTSADARLRLALSLVHAVVFDAAGRGLCARAIRSRQGASALRTGTCQQRQRGLRSGHRHDAPERLRWHVRAWHRRSLQRHGEQCRSELPERIPRQSGARARAAPGPRVGAHRGRQDRPARQHRAVPQPARQRERSRCHGPQSPGAEHAEHHLRHHGHAAGGRSGRGILQPAERRFRRRSATRQRRRAPTTRSACSAMSAGAPCST